MPEVISSGGFRVHYEVAENSGVPVILLHPVRATGASWRELGWFDALAADGFRAVAIDARGFGRSGRVTSPVDLAPGTSSDDVLAVMTTLGIEVAHLCGFSLGAAIAVRFALDHPRRVGASVWGALAHGPLAQCGVCIGPVQGARERAVSDLATLRLSPQDELVAYFAAVRAVIESAELKPLIPSDLTGPILGIAGSEDRYDPASLYLELRGQGLPIEVVSIAGAGHGAAFAHPQFRSTALEFLRRQERGI